MIRAITGALFMTATAFATAEEPPHLKGLRAGMSEQELLTAMPSLRCRPVPAHLGDRSCSDPKNTIVGHPAHVSVTLINDRAARVLFFFSADHVKEMANAVTKKYGKATGSISLPARSAGGVELSRELTTWNIGDEYRLELSNLPGSARGTWLSLSDTIGRTETMKRAKREQERKAKDF